MRSATAIIKESFAAIEKKYMSYERSSDKSEAALRLADAYHLIERRAQGACAAVRAAGKNGVRIKSEDESRELLRLCEEAVTSVPLDDSSGCAEIIGRRSLSLSQCELIEPYMAAALLRLCARSLDSQERLTPLLSQFYKFDELDFSAVFEKACDVEQLLMHESAGVYADMSEETRFFYRRAVARQAERSGESEVSVARRALERARQSGSHVGFYLPLGQEIKGRRSFLIALKIMLPILASVLFCVLLGAEMLIPMCFLPFYGLLGFIPELLGERILKRGFLARMRLKNEVSPEQKTVVAVSMLLPDADGAAECYEHLKQVRLTVCRGSAGLCVLADLPSSGSPHAAGDLTSVEAMRRVVARLNGECGGGAALLVRERSYSETQGEYTGFERKRGAITALAHFIESGECNFGVCFGDRSIFKNAAYILALDQDSLPSLDALNVMLSAAAHPLNKPVISKTEKRVVGGYGIIAPVVETSVESANKTFFSFVFSGSGGLPSYSQGARERIFDMFGEGVFSGKGLIDVGAYNAVLAHAFPKERVLSHDIPEGMIMRTAFASGAVLTDSFPSNENAYLRRQHRWIRGDTQNLKLLFGSYARTASGVFVLCENFLRALTPAACLFLIIASLFLDGAARGLFAALGVLAVIAPDVVSGMRTLLGGGISLASRLYFSSAAPLFLRCLLRAAVLSVMLEREAVCALDAVIRSLYRMLISKKRLLEWTTAAQSERTRSALDFLSSLSSLLLGAVIVAFSSGAASLAGVMMCLEPLLCVLSGKKRIRRRQRPSESEKKEILSYCASMWRFFDKYCRAEDNFLIPDNVQLAPVYAVAHRTSPTNIGMLLLSVLAARDMGFIGEEEMLARLEKTLETLERMEKYRGHFYNWYDTRTLAVLKPAFISCVDSGNLLCSLTALIQGLETLRRSDARAAELVSRFKALRDGCDAAFLYDKRRKLMRIGYSVDSASFTSSHFDLLMSEARLASYYCASRGEVESSHWFALGRALSGSGRYAGPVSWSGTMFEYFMPCIFLPVYDNTLISEALRFCLHCQKSFAAKRGVPYGVSESGYYAFDSGLIYMYKAHGVNELSIQKGRTDETVISPYSSFLTLECDMRDALANLRRLKRAGLMTDMGFSEAADYTKSRCTGRRPAVVRSVMAHHTGMSFLSCANALFDGIMRRRFMSDTNMRGGESLLLESVPSNDKVIRHRSAHTRLEKRERSARRVTQRRSCRAAALSNGEWSAFISESGSGVSLYCGKSIFKIRNDSLTPDGVLAAVRIDGEIYPLGNMTCSNRRGSQSLSACESFCTLLSEGESVTASQKIFVVDSSPAQAHEFTVKNKTRRRLKGELLIFCEPSLEDADRRTEHPAYFNMFTRVKEKNGCAVFHRSSDESGLYVTVGFTRAARLLSTDREACVPRITGYEGLFSALRACNSESVDKCVAMSAPFEIEPRGVYKNTLIVCAAHGEEASYGVFGELRLRECSQGLCASTLNMPAGSLESVYCEKLISRLFFCGLPSAESVRFAEKNVLGVNALWEKGISGDYPIITVFASDGDYSCVAPFLSLRSRLSTAGISCETVFVTDRPDEYLSEIRLAARRAGMTFPEALVGVRKGIFVISRTETSDAFLALLRAVSVCAFPESELKKQPNGGEVVSLCKSGGENSFIGDGYYIGETPYLPWSHVLANRSFGTLVTDSSLGFTWCCNSRENALTRHYADTRRRFGAEVLLCRIDGRVYDVAACSSVRYYEGRAVYSCNIGAAALTVGVTVGKKAMCKHIFIKAELPKDCAAELIYAVFPSLGGTLPRLIKKSVADGCCALKNPSSEGGAAVIECDRKCSFFFDSLLLPGGFRGVGDCAAAICSVTGSDSAHFSLSFASSCSAARKMRELELYGRDGTVIKAQLHNKELETLVNTFLPVQTITARINARTGFYQVSGAYGFRDQLQDACAVAMTHPKELKRMILKCCAAQFSQGDVLHWFHERFEHNQRRLCGVRTRCSDDMLWLPLAFSLYCAQTGDLSLGEKRLPFINAPELGKNEAQRYGEFTRGEETASVYSHCLRAIKRACRFGEHSLPLIGSCDWNDSFNLVGAGGRGESVWLGMFLSLVARLFGGTAQRFGDEKNAAALYELAEKMNRAVSLGAWSGDRYLRAFYDDMTPMGAENDSACEIDLLVQSFAAIAQIGSLERRKIAVETAYRELVDKKHRVVRLFKPPFTPHTKRAGYVNDYPEGVRENGGQYTHAAVWLAQAFFCLGEDERGIELIKMLSPADREEQIFKTEPYYTAADVYYAPGMKGRGGWSVYTGSAGQYYALILRELFGLRRVDGKLTAEPKILDGERIRLDFGENSQS